MLTIFNFPAPEYTQGRPKAKKDIHVSSRMDNKIIIVK